LCGANCSFSKATNTSQNVLLFSCIACIEVQLDQHNEQRVAEEWAKPKWRNKGSEYFNFHIEQHLRPQLNADDELMFDQMVVEGRETYKVIGSNDPEVEIGLTAMMLDMAMNERPLTGKHRNQEALDAYFARRQSRMNLDRLTMTSGVRTLSPEPYLGLGTRTQMTGVAAGSRLAAESAQFAVVTKAPSTRRKHRKVRMSELMMSLRSTVLQPREEHGDADKGIDRDVEMEM